MFRRTASTSLPVVGFALAAVVFGLDQLSKYWVLSVLDMDSGEPGASFIELTPFFDLHFTMNPGVSFGLFPAEGLIGRSILVAFSLAVSGVLAFGLMGRGGLKAHRMMQAVAFGLIIGGALGNVIDRIRFGAVVDFFDFSAIYFPWIFNIADAGITVGVIVLLADLLLSGDGAA